MGWGSWRVRSETSPGGSGGGGGGGGSQRSCRRRRSSGGGNASAPGLPPCHWRAWSLPPPSFPSPRPSSTPPAPPAVRLRTGPKEEEPQAPWLPTVGKRGPRYFPVPRPWTPQSVPRSRVGLLSGRKRACRAASGFQRRRSLRPPPDSYSPSQFPARPGPARPSPPPAFRHPRPGAPLPSALRGSSADHIGSARVPEPPANAFMFSGSSALAHSPLHPEVTLAPLPHPGPLVGHFVSLGLHLPVPLRRPVSLHSLCHSLLRKPTICPSLTPLAIAASFTEPLPTVHRSINFVSLLRKSG